MESTKESQGESKKESYDVFRDSPLRYLGYANEVGESFRYQFPSLVTPSYVLAFGYCAADSVSKGYDVYSSSNTNPTTTRLHDTVRATLDTLVWQSLASVMIPGATINLLVKATRAAVRRSPLLLPGLVQEWLPTATGLASIPLIIHPIDHSVDYFMDHTFRILWPPAQEPPK